MSPKILIVDDDTYIRELYLELLTDEGFDVDSAVDGDEALEKLLKGGYCVTLLDIMMPKRDGLGVLEALRKGTPKEKNGPIILLTNLGHDPIIEKALQLGASTMLVKADLTPDQVVDNVKKWLPKSE